MGGLCTVLVLRFIKPCRKLSGFAVHFFERNDFDEDGMSWNRRKTVNRATRIYVVLRLSGSTEDAIV